MEDDEMNYDPWLDGKIKDLREEQIRNRESKLPWQFNRGGGDALESNGRAEAQQEGDGKEGGGLVAGGESGLEKDGGRGESNQGGQLRREQDREFEERTALTDACMECGQTRSMHALVRGARLTKFEDPDLVKEPLVLICPRSTFTPYR